MSRTASFTLDDRLPEDHFAAALRADVLAGLAEPPRVLPPKWFYDARGGELFEEITGLPEYYPTRAEQEILNDRARAVAALTGARTLVELGSGSSRKTRTLLDALGAAGTLEHYAPLDVSADALRAAGEELRRDYPDLDITATAMDFTDPAGAPLVAEDAAGPRLVAFLGSTIGNLDPAQRAAFLRSVRAALRPGDALLLGADLVKNTDSLVHAYDDAQGVTAAFNRNVLRVLNRELDADFDPEAFDHVALWNPEQEWVEMRLRSRTAQTVKIPALDLTLELAEGETIRTETSAKFRRERLSAELAAAGMSVERWWTDRAGRFALVLAVPA